MAWRPSLVAARSRTLAHSWMPWPPIPVMMTSFCTSTTSARCRLQRTRPLISEALRLWRGVDLGIVVKGPWADHLDADLDAELLLQPAFDLIGKRRQGLRGAARHEGNHQLVT